MNPRILIRTVASPSSSVFFPSFLSETLQMSYRPIHSRSMKHQFLDGTKSWQKRCEDDLHYSLCHNIGTSRNSSLSPLVPFDTSTSICCDSSFCFPLSLFLFLPTSVWSDSLHKSIGELVLSTSTSSSWKDSEVWMNCHFDDDIHCITYPITYPNFNFNPALLYFFSKSIFFKLVISSSSIVYDRRDDVPHHCNEWQQVAERQLLP